MQVTNTTGLPGPIVAAVMNDDYDAGGADYTITQLIDPPRKVALSRQHADEIVEDASDLICALMGKAVHNILERANIDGVTEERLFMRVNGALIAGRFDHMVVADGALTDYKMASVWEWMYGIKPDRERQLNCYAALLRENDREVKAIRAAFIFRDWSKRKARTEADYPDTQVKIADLPLWKPIEALTYIEGRLAEHRAAEFSLPECTPDERWAKPPTWAVKKKGQKKALRVLSSEAEAAAWILDNRGTKGITAASASIEYRPGESVRCQDYCKAAPFCSQWAAIRDGSQ